MVPFAGLLAALEGIPDPRRRQGRRYPLAPLLLLAVLAVPAGATSYRGIRVSIGVHRERLNASRPPEASLRGALDHATALPGRSRRTRRATRGRAHRSRAVPHHPSGPSH